jgi:4-hydroxy-tetrahydrodipicolinate reductase
MGRMLTEILSDPSGGHRLGGLIEVAGHPEIGGVVRMGMTDQMILDDPAALARDIEIGLDFSAPGCGLRFAHAIAERGAALLVGTTGIIPADLEELRVIARAIPVLVASNTSVGVFCLSELSMHARKILGDSYDVEIVEMHHRHKKDAPSGTALSLASRLSGTGLNPVWDRDGARKDGEIGISSARGGEVVGVHTIYFLGASDQIELTHRANSRKCLADGAIRLGAALAGKAPGMYDVTDLLR